MALCADEELSVTELSQVLDDSQPQVSKRVSALRDAGLMASRRDGTRLYLKTLLTKDPVVLAAIAEGQRLCLADGSLARVPGVVAAREEMGVSHFELGPSRRSEPSSPEHLAHLAALGPVLPGRRLAIDVGTGDGLVLDVLAPLYQRVIAVDRSRAQLAHVAERVAARGFHHVSLYPGSYDDTALMERVDGIGGADLVFVGRALHHQSRLTQALSGFRRLLRRGGHLVVLDYLAHDTEPLRSGQGDVWAGFDPGTMRRLFDEAGLVPVGDVPIPAGFHPVGFDVLFMWYVWVV